MRASVLLAAASALGGNAIRILQSNDDGWAELYVRSFHDALMSAGHDVVLSAPAENKSGSGSLDVEPQPRDKPCEYNSCPANSGPTGTNSTNKRLNWVNSYPVTSLRYGLEHYGPLNWAGQPAELVVSGPNVGSNVWLQVPFSGTVGVAVYAAHNAHIPGIAFSGATDGNLPWNTRPVPTRAKVYAELAARLTQRVVGTGKKPYLPSDVWLNVNFPEVGGSCETADDFQWVMTRINPGWFSAPDADHCGSTRLPTEEDVKNKEGCLISVSVGDAADKTTVDAERQKVVLDRIGDMFICV